MYTGVSLPANAGVDPVLVSQIYVLLVLSPKDQP